MTSSDPQYVDIVQQDFEKLSSSYDLINNFMSLGTDRQFRYLTIKHLISGHRGDKVKLNTWIDLGSGTGHLGNEIFLQKPDVYILAMDITKSMLDYCRERTAWKKGAMDLLLGDVSKLPFRDHSFDGGFSGFVGRHFNDYSKTLTEHHRIIRPLGRYSMLEMGRRATPLSPIIDIYVGQVMSFLGKLAVFLVTKGNAPFRLLEDTYANFHSPNTLLKFFTKAGFKSWYKLGLLGSIVIMLGIRRP